MTAPIILFDGLCAFCSWGVGYVLAHERPAAEPIRFVAIQSGEGRRLASIHGVSADDPETFLFIEDGRVLEASDGVIGVCRHLDGPARLVGAARLLPKRWRDAAYRLLARHRYRLFGRRAACLVPDAGTRRRFALPD